MKAIDLFCGAGGSSMGLKQAGFDDIVGIDIKYQPEYPFNFYEDDVFNLLFNLSWIKQFDFIWASPPCQAYSIASNIARAKGKKYPDLINKTRQLLLKTNKPFVIENVCQAPIRKDLILNGSIFDLGVIRYRAFEIEGFEVPMKLFRKRTGTVCDGSYVSIVGKGTCSKTQFYKLYMKKHGLKTMLEMYQHAMDIDWITDLRMIAEAVPPAYAKYIGEEFLKNK